MFFVDVEQLCEIKPIRRNLGKTQWKNFSYDRKHVFFGMIFHFPYTSFLLMYFEKFSNIFFFFKDCGIFII